MKAGQIEKGQYIIFKGEPFYVTEREFVNPGKGSAFVRCKLKGVKTGQVLKETMKAQDNVDIADVTNKNCQYLYDDDSYYHFMDNETYDQFGVDKTGLELYKDYMHDGETYQVILFEGQPIDIIMPPKVALTVMVAPDAIKGDTATSVTKLVECDTGAKIKVPGFIKEGEKILVNTETGEYAERVNE